MREFVDISLQESIAERTHSVGWENLTEGERQVFWGYLLHDYLLDGGLSTAMAELGRKGMPRAFEGLSRIGAKEAASIVADAPDFCGNSRFLADASGSYRKNATLPADV